MQDMYPWGGEIRDTDIHPGGRGIAHCLPQFIIPENDRAFDALAARDYLRGFAADVCSNGLS